LHWRYDAKVEGNKKNGSNNGGGEQRLLLVVSMGEVKFSTTY